ncbi:MAG TPA: aspartate ammonia-lyase [Thermoleophilia bacterium]|nr:aspartate ammonia-lyase [Thermoleophilia bacterium]
MRRERDSLGDKQVPDAALYGIQTQRAVENFPISGLPPRPELVDGIVLVKKAAALVNRELGILPADKAEAIVRAADEVLSGAHRKQFVVDPFQAGAGTSHNMNANEVLANRANELLGGGPRGVYQPVHPNDDVNRGQSSNDAIPTAIRLALQRPAADLLDALLALDEALAAKAAEFDHVLKSARTHLQDAVPIRLGQEFAAYAVTVRKARDRLASALEETRALHIGGTAAGTGLNTDPRYAGLMVARLSELAGVPLRPAVDLVQATQSLDDFVAFSAALRGAALSLIQIANDLRLLSSGPRTGIAEIALPPVQPGSSIMPGKVNPVMAEMLDMVCFHVAGSDAAVALAAQAGQLEINVMTPLVAFELLFSIQVLTAAIVVFTERCVRGIEADEENCRRWGERSLGLATALNPVIGYDAAAEVAKEAHGTGRTVPEVVLERGILTADELAEQLDPPSLTQPRSRPQPKDDPAG